MHSEDILTLWKSQMIGNDLVVFIQIQQAEQGFIMTVFTLNGFSPMKKSFTVTQAFVKTYIGGVWRKAYVFKFNKTFTWIPLYE